MQGEAELKQLKSFFKSGRHLEFQKGELIIRANEVPVSVYLIESGIVKIYALSRHNDQHIHHFFGPSDFLPINWTFKDDIRNLYYECVEPVAVSAVPTKAFLDFVLDNKAITLEMLEEVMLHYIRYAGRVENLLYSDARERCSYRLLSLANRFGVRTAAGVEINASITHEDMARSLNMTRETFGRALNRFQRAGVVSYDQHRHLVIKDLASLIKIIGQDEAREMWPRLSSDLA